MIVMAKTPDTETAWLIIYLDLTAITTDQSLVERALNGDVMAQCNIVNHLTRLPPHHLEDADGRMDPSIAFRRGLIIEQVA